MSNQEYKKYAKRCRKTRWVRFKESCERKILKDGPQCAFSLMESATNLSGRPLRSGVPRSTKAASLILRKDKRFVLLSNPKDRVCVWGVADEE